MEKYVKRILVNEKDLQKRIKELAKWVDKNYKDSDNLLIVCILKSSFVFAGQLIPQIKTMHEVDFMITSSYSKGTKKSEEIKLVLDLNRSIKDRRVLIVEDMIDTGQAIEHLKQMLMTRKPRDIKVMTLLSKTDKHPKKLEPDIAGFKIGTEFVIGFGMDYEEKYRNLPYVAIFNEDYK